MRVPDFERLSCNLQTLHLHSCPLNLQCSSWILPKSFQTQSPVFMSWTKRTCGSEADPEKYIPESVRSFEGHSRSKIINHPLIPIWPKSFHKFSLSKDRQNGSRAWPSLLPVMRFDPQNCTADTESSDYHWEMWDKKCQLFGESIACIVWHDINEPNGNPPTEPTTFSTTPSSHRFSPQIWPPKPSKRCETSTPRAPGVRPSPLPLQGQRVEPEKPQPKILPRFWVWEKKILRIKNPIHSRFGTGF